MSGVDLSYPLSLPWHLQHRFSLLLVNQFVLKVHVDNASSLGVRSGKALWGVIFRALDGYESEVQRKRLYTTTRVESVTFGPEVFLPLFCINAQVAAHVLTEEGHCLGTPCVYTCWFMKIYLEDCVWQWTVQWPLGKKTACRTRWWNLLAQ